MKNVCAIFLGLIASAEAINIHSNIHSHTLDNPKYFLAQDAGMTPNGVEYTRVIPEMYNDESEN